MHSAGRLFFILVVLTIFPGSVYAASFGEFEQRVNKGMGLIGVFPGLTRTSTPLSVRVRSGSIPDGAVVESVSVVTGTITNDKRANAVNVISSYNIQGPEMNGYVSTRWAGKGRPTTFSAAELGDGDIPVEGTWRISMTGNNAGIARATTSHTVRSLRFRYRYMAK